MRIRLIVAAVMATCIAGTAQAQEARPNKETVGAVGRVEIPPEIAPAMFPYMMCLQQAMGEVSKASNGLDEAEYAAAGPVVREKCASARRTALDQGVKLLADRKAGKAEERAPRVEATLANIENTFLTPKFPAPVGGSN